MKNLLVTKHLLSKNAFSHSEGICDICIVHDKKFHIAGKYDQKGDMLFSKHAKFQC